MSGRWWRAYDGCVDDPKLQSLPPVLFKFWFNLLCVASENDGLIPPLSELKQRLKARSDHVEAHIKDLLNRGLIDEIDGRLEPHNWRKRQYKSDNSTPRVQAHREAKRNVSVTPPDTETDTETDKKQDSIGRSPAATRPKVDERFEEFWKAYPKREGANPKQPARKLFIAAIKAGADPPEIIEGARRYAVAERDKIGSPYIPQAMTWLRQQRWKDYAAGGGSAVDLQAEKQRILDGIRTGNSEGTRILPSGDSARESARNGRPQSTALADDQPKRNAGAMASLGTIFQRTPGFSFAGDEADGLSARRRDDGSG